MLFIALEIVWCNRLNVVDRVSTGISHMYAMKVPNSRCIRAKYMGFAPFTEPIISSKRLTIEWVLFFSLQSSKTSWCQSVWVYMFLCLCVRLCRIDVGNGAWCWKERRLEYFRVITRFFQLYRGVDIIFFFNDIISQRMQIAVKQTDSNRNNINDCSNLIGIDFYWTPCFLAWIPIILIAHSSYLIIVVCWEFQARVFKRFSVCVCVLFNSCMFEYSRFYF